MNVFQAAGHVIQPVLTFPALVVFAGNRYRIKLGWQQVFGIFKCQANFSQAGCTARFTAIEYQAFQVFTAEVTDLMLPDHPPDTIDDITLTTAVRANDSGDTFIKMKDGLVGKTFKSFDF